jgi:hypothetical protein
MMLDAEATASRALDFIVLADIAVGLVACDAPIPETFGLFLTPQGAVELRFGKCVPAGATWVQRAIEDRTRPVWEIVPKEGAHRPFLR